MSQRERGDTLPDVTLTCQNASCGNAFAFTGGEQNFFNQRGFSPPALCPSCRAEKKAQQDVEVSCQVCGFTRSVRKEYIISFRRKQGPWVPPTLCRMCEEDPERAARIMQKNAATQQANAFFAGNQSNPRQHVFSDQRGRYGQRVMKEAKKLLTNLIANTGSLWVIQLQSETQPLNPLQIAPAWDYAKIEAPARKGEKPPINREQHIWGDPDRPDIVDNHKEALQGHGYETFQDVVMAADEIANTKDSDTIVEWRQEKDKWDNEYMVKYDCDSGLFTVIDDSCRKWPTPYVVTVFPKSMHSVANRLVARF